MADDLHVIADLIADALDLAPIEVMGVLKASPFVNLLPIDKASNGTTDKYPVQTGAPVVGFRAPNAGLDLDSSDDTLVTINLKYMDWSWMVDVAVANAWRKGRENYIAREGLRFLAAALLTFEKQVFNGQIGANDSAGAYSVAAGFTGFRDAATVDALADGMVVNAGGTTADVNSSVWAVRVAEDGICGVVKGEGEPFELMETTIVQRIVNPGTDNKQFPAYYTPGGTWLGLRIGGPYDIGRIANVSTDVGKGLTDNLLSQLVERFPVGYGPTHILMSRRSRGQLQRSRTATSPTGSEVPLPKEYEGLPILATDAISVTEELVA